MLIIEWMDRSVVDQLIDGHVPQSIYSNVVIGYQTGVFFHFGATNNATANLFIHCNTSVRTEACYNLPRDSWCNLPLNDTDKGDTMIAALHAAMSWPTWPTLWLETYPALSNITWAPVRNSDHILGIFAILCHI